MRRRVATPVAPDGIAAGGDALYVVGQEGPRLVTLAASDGSVRSVAELGRLPQLYDSANLDVAVAPDAVWVSSYAENLVRRIPRG